MFFQDFWTAPSCHLALNPHCPHDADGLLDFARRQGWSSRCFFQTSGSEGVPKWVSLNKEAFLISARAVNAHFRVSAADRWLIALPLHHVGGFSIAARAYLSDSSYVQCAGKWQPKHFVDLCRNEEITLVSLVPAQVHDLVIEKLCCPKKLRAVIIGGGAISNALLKSAQTLGWPVFQSYGMTEAASQIATQSLELPDEDGLEILPHWQISTDSTGHLILSGPALANAYLKRGSEGEWSCSEIGGRLTTRDLVRLSQQSSRHLLHFVGRESGVIKILGELIHLAPLQDRLDQILMEQGSSARPVILALPDARREMKLVLVLDSGDPGPWLSAYNRCVNSLCQITETRRVPAVPRTALGKVDHLMLKARLS